MGAGAVVAGDWDCGDYVGVRMSLKSMDFNRGGRYLFSKSSKPNENARTVLLVYEGPVPAAVKGGRLMMFRSATGTWKECFTEAQLKDYKIAPN